MLTDTGVLAEAEKLAAAERHLAAIDLLTEANRRRREDGDRYGIEFWLFAPSSFPDAHLPMVV